jgi:predicted helicase
MCKQLVMHLNLRREYFPQIAAGTKRTEYRLGNRSALECVIYPYRVTRDEQGNITSEPNRLDDERYILRLIGQVITVNLETMKQVKGLPPLE